MSIHGVFIGDVERKTNVRGTPTTVLAREVQPSRDRLSCTRCV